MQKIERQMMQQLHGGQSEDATREWERRLAADPALAARFRDFETAWRNLEIPPAAPPDEAFPAEVMTAVRNQAHRMRGDLSWNSAPAWARTGGAIALTAGLALGLTLAKATPIRQAAFAEISFTLDEATLRGGPLAEPPSLAESWWQAVEEGSPTEEEPHFMGETR